MFFTVVLSGLLLMSAYVGWRAGSVAWIRRWLPWWARAITLVVLGSSYVMAREAEGRGFLFAARMLELVGAYWIGILLLLSVAMLAADLATGFGLLVRRRLPSVRAWALVVGVVLSTVAVVQGHRAPVVRDHDVRLPGLPAASEGTTVVFVSDLHLGSMLGERWFAARVGQIEALRPSAIVLGGDILEGDSASEASLLPLLARLTAPLGVWAVAGNHEYHGGGAASLASLGHMGVRVLRNEWSQIAPGLVLAGADGGRGHGGLASSTAARGQGWLAGRPPGAATILISHQPVRVQDAAQAGVGLMLSGHTHDGQIWPFRYLVRTQTPFLAGRYEVEGMPLIVCRGTGTFGPRMRLWYPSEILRITLHSR
jgi:predicted MPP superfamily phosphohydrolase